MFHSLRQNADKVIFRAIAVVMGLAFCIISLSAWFAVESRTSRSLERYCASIAEKEASPYAEDRRCFAVIFPEEGETAVKSNQIHDLHRAEKIKIAQEALTLEKDSGYISDKYKYLKTKTGGEEIVCVMDMTNNISSLQSFILSSGVACAIVSVIAFILIRKEIEKELQPLIENLTKQQKFVQGASHELKTPITIISADIDVLEMTQGKNEWTESIRNQTKRLTSLTERLLALAKATDPDAKKSMQRFDLSAMMNDMGREFLSLSHSSGLKLELSIADDVFITGNVEDIRTLFEIIANNAFKYAGSGGKVIFSLKKSRNQATMSISNTRDVYLPDFDSIFDKFYRADQSRSRNTGGSGLGLSIAKAIADAHDAKIEASENSGIVTFTVRFKI